MTPKLTPKCCIILHYIQTYSNNEKKTLNYAPYKKTKIFQKNTQKPIDCDWCGPNSSKIKPGWFCIGYMRSIAIQGTALD